jgi:hypothetical protein
MMMSHLSLNCLMMLEIFSKRCTSALAVCVAWEITRKVAFSNSTTCPSRALDCSFYVEYHQGAKLESIGA